MELDTILIGDSAVVLKSLPDESVDLTVTSPPYDNLRAYKGFVFDFETIARELYRVTKQGGVVAWVVGDATTNGSESLTSFKQAIYFREQSGRTSQDIKNGALRGLNLHDTMIYTKVNYAPVYPSLMRYAGVFEYMFVFSKGKPNTFKPIQVERREKKVHLGNYLKPNGETERGEAYIKRKSNSYEKETKDATNVWSYSVGGGKRLHPAPFPEQLAHDHIVSWSNEGDTVLDCFAGSGTTLKMAKMLNRHYIGIEISPEYAELAQKRVDGLHEQTELK